MTFVGAPRSVAVGSVVRASGGPLHGRVVYVLRHEVLEPPRSRAGDDEDADLVRQRVLVRPASAEEAARVLAAERQQLYARFKGT